MVVFVHPVPRHGCVILDLEIVSSLLLYYKFGLLALQPY